MKLIIAEKPVLARNIVQCIRQKGKRVNDRTYMCSDYYITHLAGHIMEHVEPEKINPKWAKWRLEDLPICVRNWPKEVKKDKQELYDNIKSLLELDEIDEVVNAGDMDAEGQLLVDEVLLDIGCSKKETRLNTADTTPEALKKSLESLRGNSLYRGLRDSAEARGIADMVHGFNLSRAKTLQTGIKINIGRVASFIVYSVVKRDRDIEAFASREFATLFFRAFANGKSCVVKVVLPKDDRLLDEYGYLSEPAKIEELKSLIEGKDFSGEVKETDVRRAPPMPFSLLTLQKHMQKFKIKPDETLELTQSLRDKYNLITYNRTEHCELPMSYYDSHERDVQTVLGNLRGMNIAYCEEPGYKSKCFVDSEKVAEHFGIIPQNVFADMSQLTDKERLCYCEIAKRYLMQFMGDDIDHRKVLTIDLPEGRIAKACQTVLVKQGWSRLESPSDEDDDEEKEENTEIPFTDEKEFRLSGCHVRMSKTKPPKRFTLADLLAHLKKNGLGTPATRDAIVNRQFESGYLVMSGKFVTSTPLAHRYVENVPEEIMSPEVTRKWESIQQRIENGEASIDTLVESVLESIDPIIKGAKADAQTIRENRMKLLPPFWKGENSYNYRDGDFIKVIYRKSGIFHKITEAQAKKLLEKGSATKVNLFSMRRNEVFKADVTVREWRKSGKFLIPEIDYVVIEDTPGKSAGK